MLFDDAKQRFLNALDRECAECEEKYLMAMIVIDKQAAEKVVFDEIAHGKTGDRAVLSVGRMCWLHNNEYFKDLAVRAFFAAADSEDLGLRDAAARISEDLHFSQKVLEKLGVMVQTEPERYLRDFLSRLISSWQK